MASMEMDTLDVKSTRTGIHSERYIARLKRRRANAMKHDMHLDSVPEKAARISKSQRSGRMLRRRHETLSTHNSFPFLSLPGELRNLIYEHVFSGQIILPDLNEFDTLQPANVVERTLWSTIGGVGGWGLVQSCHQIWREITSMLPKLVWGGCSFYMAHLPAWLTDIDFIAFMESLEADPDLMLRQRFEPYVPMLVQIQHADLDISMNEVQDCCVTHNRIRQFRIYCAGKDLRIRLHVDTLANDVGCDGIPEVFHFMSGLQECQGLKSVDVQVYMGEKELKAYIETNWPKQVIQKAHWWANALQGCLRDSMVLGNEGVTIEEWLEVQLTKIKSEGNVEPLMWGVPGMTIKEWLRKRKSRPVPSP